MKEKILNKILEFIDPKTGYLHVDKSLDIGCHGNILEWSGQLLMALKDYPNLAKKVIDGLLKNEVIDGFVPRTKDSFVRDKKVHIWENWSNAWWRTDVSHSQLSFLCMGLYEMNTKESMGLLSRIIQRLCSDNFKIKNINNEITDDGVFHFYGNQGLRKILMIELAKKFNINLKVNFIERKLLKLNLWIVSKGIIKLKESDSFNAWILLKALANVHSRYEKYFEGFCKKYNPVVPGESTCTMFPDGTVAVTANTLTIDLENNCENAIRYLLLGDK